MKLPIVLGWAAVALAAWPGGARAQDRLVRVRADVREAIATVSANDTVLGTLAIVNGEGAARFPIPRGAVLTVTVRALRYERTRRLEVASDDREIEVVFGPTAVPAATVTWRVGTGRADILVDAASVGTTVLERQVAHGRRRFEWKRGGVVVCQVTVTLDPGTTRCYSCDPATGTVSEC